MAVTTSPLTGWPSKAPLRSTRCRRRQPPSTHLAAMLTGSSENTVESSMRPWRRRTQAPSLRSIAGIISIALNLFESVEVGGGSALLERPEVAFDALETVLEHRLHIENGLVVVVRGDLATEQIQHFLRLERAQLELEALLQEALDQLHRRLFLGSVEIQDRRLALDAAHLPAPIPGGEILQQLQAVGMALLRVELHGETRAIGQRRGEILAVMAATNHLLGIAGLDVVAVHEVEARQIRNIVPQRMLDRLTHLVPAHVRHLQLLAVLDHALAEEAHLAGEQADAVDPIVLFAAFEQGLHADADTEKRPILTDLADQLIETQTLDLGHAVADRTNPGEHHAIGFADHPGIAGHQHPAGADVLQGLGHRVQVAHAVIDNCDRLHQRQPLVDGICPAMRGSSSTAMRRARPKALNTVSIWWWVLVPRRLSMCRLTRAWLTKPWKNSWNRSTSKPPTTARVKGTCICRPGRPEKSITTLESASSSGT